MRDSKWGATGAFYDDDKPQISDDFIAAKRGQQSRRGRRSAGQGEETEANFKYCVEQVAGSGRGTFSS